MDTETGFLDNIKAYRPLYYDANRTSTVWHKLPVARRSAVLVLLFLGKYGELRVVLTKRSRSLRNFSGHISFPGGKADTGLESEWDTARRETDEEIGIPKDDALLRQLGVEIEKLNFLPCFLARTLLAVRPCVGILRATSTSNSEPHDYNVVNNRLLKLTLNPGESSSVFSVPLREFYDQRRIKNLAPKPSELVDKKAITANWGGMKWHYRSLLFPQHNEASEAGWLHEVDDLSSDDEQSEAVNNSDVPSSNVNLAQRSAMQQNDRSPIPVRNVWGLTANILHELAYIAYGGEEYWRGRRNIGEEDMIHALLAHGGQMKPGKRSEFEVRVINGDKGVSFYDTLPEDKVEELKKIYNSGAKI